MKIFSSWRMLFLSLLFKKKQREKALFDHHFFECKYYLHKSASEEHMVNILNISIHQLNEITLNHYKMNFNELCEKYKFEHFWSEVTNPLNGDLPVHSIIESSGFASNADFNNTINLHNEESINLISKKYI